MTRPISIRRRLLIDIVVAMIVLGVAVLATTVVGARRAVRSLSGSLIARSLHQTEARLERFFDPVTGGLLVARAWGEEGLLDPEDPDALTGLLVPLMKQYPQISSMMVADGRGREHMVLRVGEAWSVRRTRRDEWGRRTFWLEWSEDEPRPRESWREIDYDPRSRPWFSGAVERAGAAEGGPALHWTEPYRFFTTKDPGITASVTFDPPGDDGVSHVIGFDVLLNEITRFTTSLRPSPHGVAFVLTAQGQVIGLPGHERYATPEARRVDILKLSSEVALPEMRDGAAAFFEQPPERREGYRYVSGGEAWWAGLRSFELGPRTLLIGVGVPEADLLGHLSSIRVWIIGITLAVLAGACWRAVVLARRFSRPIEALVRESDRISRGDLEAGAPVESRTMEVRRLARAHEQMRRGLQTLMKLERDLQLARQIQEQTFPARLPELEGFAIDAWSEPADETGGDTFDVIGYRSGRADGPIVLSAGQADRAVLLMADATGHGIGPALSVTQIRAMLRMAVRSRTVLADVARHLNEQLYADLPEGRFITAWLGVLGAADGTLQSFSAGQAPILRYVAARDVFEVRPADTLPFGVVEDLEIALADPIRLDAGDIFAVISDGIYEAADAAGTQYGTERVTEVIKAHRDETPAAIIEAIREAVRRFTGDAPADDDRTGIVIKKE